MVVELVAGLGPGRTLGLEVEVELGRALEHEAGSAAEVGALPPAEPVADSVDSSKQVEHRSTSGGGRCYVSTRSGPRSHGPLSTRLLAQ
jgi:hypothetical protein